MEFENLNNENNINNLKEESKNRQKDLISMLRGLYLVTNEPCIKLKLESIELNDIFDKLTMHMDTLSHIQYSDLINIANQFKEVLENYIKENNIKLEE